jgi:hypothetical protein
MTTVAWPVFIAAFEFHQAPSFVVFAQPFVFIAVS